jgi:hypothetical protein
MDENKLTTLMLISAAGLLLTWWGLQAGASQASPSTPPSTPISSLVDDLIDRAQSPLVSRVQTVTLDPLLDDLMQNTWRVRVDDRIYNKPGGTDMTLPADACNNVVWSVAVGVAVIRCEASATLIRLPVSPTIQPWVAVTYWTYTRAFRDRDLIQVAAGAFSNQPYNPITVTFVYTRQFQSQKCLEAKCPDDFWGDVTTYPILTYRSPTPDKQSDEERWVRWVANADGITATVVVSEPLYGSDLTVTQLLMSPAAPKFREKTFFTATIQNIGVMTVWRWYAVELYVKPAWAPPPQNANDHVGGWDDYNWDALFVSGGDWKQRPPLGPGQIQTVTTAINIPLPGTFKAYAQVDTAYYDPNHYIYSGEVPFWGSNAEGYAIPPYSEERNVLGIEPFTIKGSVTYLPFISRK